MTEAMNKTTSRLKHLEVTNVQTMSHLQTLSDRMSIQEKAISQQQADTTQLGQAVSTQNNLITAIQENQVTQGNTILCMDGRQTQVL